MKMSEEKTMMLASLGSLSGHSQKCFKNRPAPRRQAKETEFGMSGWRESGRESGSNRRKKINYEAVHISVEPY